MAVQPCFQNMLGLHVEYKSCIFKIERVMAIFVPQGEAKSEFSQNFEILKSC